MLPKPLLARWRVLPGLVILIAAFLAGSWLRARLGLIVPGNILGLFLLLGALALRIVRLRWIEEAAGALLWLLPLLFLPIFVGAAEDRRFWVERGGVYALAVLAGLLALYAFVGHLAQFLFRRATDPADLPGPLTDTEAHAARAGGPRPEVRP